MEFIHEGIVPTEKRVNMQWITKTLAENPKVNNRLIMNLCEKDILPRGTAANWYFANRCVRATSFMMWYVSLLEKGGEDQNSVLTVVKKFTTEAIHECLATV